MLLEAARAALSQSVAAQEVSAASQILDTDRLGPSTAPVRMVVQNWKRSPGLVPIGDVRLQLDPGQEVTLWLDRPRDLAVEPEDADTLDALSILTDEDSLLG
jgi:hypothetical protein